MASKFSQAQSPGLASGMQTRVSGRPPELVGSCTYAGPPTAIAFLPDGNRVISGSFLNMIHWWDIGTSDTQPEIEDICASLDAARAFEPFERNDDDKTSASICEFNWRNGWLCKGGVDGELLLWVPPSYRESLCDMGVIRLGTRSSQVNLSHFVHGTSWTHCRSPPMATSGGGEFPATWRHREVKSRGPMECTIC
jgi:hypothetical protein